MAYRDLFRYGGLLTAASLLLGAALWLDVAAASRPAGALEQPPAEASGDPKPAAAAASTPLAPVPCSPDGYASALISAARAYQVPVLSPEVLRQPLRGGVEFAGKHRLDKGGTLRTAHLVVRASVDPGDPDNGDRPLLLLSIQNRADVPVAYRVVTRVADTDACLAKRDLPHNAIVLAPHQTVQRSECVVLPRGGARLTVTQIEAYEVSAMGQASLSRLQPFTDGPFDMRVAGAHDRGALPACAASPWSAPSPGEKDWRRVIDFFARHDCDAYSLPAGYQPWTAPGTLPACPDEALR